MGHMQTWIIVKTIYKKNGLVFIIHLGILCNIIFCEIGLGQLLHNYKKKTIKYAIYNLGDPHGNMAL